MAKKTAGALTGWVSYSWSKSERRFDHVNNGEWFPFEYDRRHKLNVMTNYILPIKEKCKFNKSFSINFTLATGNYISIGKQFYQMQTTRNTGNILSVRIIFECLPIIIWIYHTLWIIEKEREVHGYSAFIICIPARILPSYTTNRRKKE